MKQENLLVQNSWVRENKYIYSHVGDFNFIAKKRATETGLKYVLKGEEYYTFNGKTHVVKQGRCLVVNPGHKIEIHTKKNALEAEGLCINIDSTLLNDIYANCFLSDESLIDNGRNAALNEFDFCEIISPENDVLCEKLNYLSKFLDKRSGSITLEYEEIFFSLAKSLLRSQSVIRAHASQIKACKYSTQVELYKRLSIAKQRLDEAPGAQTNIIQLAADAALSEFHFYRSFKQAFGISPYQYQLKRRLEKARSTLMTGKKSVADVAYMTGFSDVPGFCRSFKKEYLISPGQVKNCNRSN